MRCIIPRPRARQRDAQATRRDSLKTNAGGRFIGAKATRETALAAVKPGGVVMHIGLQDWASEIDMRKLTLAEITLIGTYTYTTADLRATVRARTGVDLEPEVRIVGEAA